MNSCKKIKLHFYITINHLILLSDAKKNVFLKKIIPKCNFFKTTIYLKSRFIYIILGLIRFSRVSLVKTAVDNTIGYADCLKCSHQQNFVYIYYDKKLTNPS